MWKRLFLAVFIFLAFEVGIFLILFPWSSAWERNYFLTIAGLRELLLSNYLRGAVSGLGLANVFLGVDEAWNFRQRLRELESQARAADRVTAA